MKKKGNTGWLFGLQVVFLLIFLGFAIFFPWTTVKSIALVFAAVTILQGMIALIDGLASIGLKRTSPLMILYGLGSLALGFFIVWDPTISIVMLIYVLAAWILISGMSSIATALSTRIKLGQNIMFIGGVITILLAFTMFVFPVATAIGFMWFLGIYLSLSIVFGLADSFSQEKSDESSQ